MEHTDLDIFLEQLVKAEQINDYFGVWLQESKNEISEYSYSFPKRISFSWIAKNFENLLSQDVYEKFLKFGNIKSKSIDLR